MNKFNSKPDPFSLLLIGGQGRSGTTLLQELCDNHPQISISHESKAFQKTGKGFLEYYQALRKPDHRKRIFKRDRLSNYLYFWRFIFQIIRQAYRKASIVNVHQAYQSLYPGATIVGDKYPGYLWHLKSLTAYEGIRIVIIYRDGRDVAQSIHARMLTDWEDKKWAQKKYSSFDKIALRWVKAIETMEEHADRIYIIRYEDLVTNPKAELVRLAEYLKVDPAGFDHEMVSSSIGKYRQGLTEEQLAEFVAIAGPTLERLGYLDSHGNGNTTK